MRKEGETGMNTVEPIRDWDLLLDIEDHLECKKSKRNYVLFMSGIYLGIRISDILELRVSDVRNKDHIFIRERKTGKENPIIINEDLKEIYKEFTAGKPRNSYLFRDERKGKPNKPISRQQVWNILNDIANHFKYDDPIGCHTLRKTFGYWLYQSDPDNIMTIKEALNHSDIDITKRYIGITQDDKDKMISKISFRGRCPKK
ncbi:tyrosine-type recombinase/integrase [Clostridium butyricum]|nr:tyrosine-type recombinase/integrase [Clostridium butyricum]